MNKSRRKYLAQAIDLLGTAQTILENVIEDEQEAFDNMPEGLQGSERGESMEETIYNLQDILENVESVQETISEIIGE